MGRHEDYADFGLACPPRAVCPLTRAAAPVADGIDFPALDAAITAQMSKHGLPGVALAVAISFIIPTAILIVVFWQVSAFYGSRFNLRTNLAYFRLGLPDVFVLMIGGSRRWPWRWRPWA